MTQAAAGRPGKAAAAPAKPILITRPPYLTEAIPSPAQESNGTRT